MADVPDDAIVRGVEDVMYGDRQLYRAEIRRQVPPGLTDGIEQELPQLLCESRQLALLQLPQLVRKVDRFK